MESVPQREREEQPLDRRASQPVAGAAGLSEEEASRRLAEQGPNELVSERKRSVLRLAADLLSEPMLLLLVAAGVIYLILGSLGEALALLAGIILIIAIELFQERRSERALAALRELSSPRALVIRSGRARRVPGREVVVGDLVELIEGDRVAADARVLRCENLMVDESLLTGESLPVGKRASGEEGAFAAPGGENTPFVYSGTLVVRGRGIALVCATADATAIGRIGRSLRDIESEDTPLRRETRRIVRIASVLGLGLCVVVAGLYAAAVRSWLQGLLAGISLAIAMTPEEFPVVLTVFLAMGAWRLSSRRVLARHSLAIEALGSATTLCSDKTGTITQNRMTVAELDVRGDALAVDPESLDALPETFHALAESALLASQEDPADPMEQAVERFARRALAGTEHLHGDWMRVREYPLSERLLSLSEVWRAPDAGRAVISAKGAPEAIADLCHLSAEESHELAERAAAMAARGLRVLGVARAYFEGPSLPREQHDFEFELLGLVGLADPPRPDVPGAIAECRRAGIRVIMITGDHRATAVEIARRIGLDRPSSVLTGEDLARLDDRTLAARIEEIGVFARITPEQKLRLVEAFKQRGEVVAMTGDGVNDAPALKAAHIGIAMGSRGTDVAREAASIVLLDDDFSSIVAAVRAGRRIYDNLRRAMVFIVAVHIPIAGVALVPLLLGWPLVLSPVHIAFLELIIDPACSLTFEAEPEEADIMSRPPRPAGEPLLTRRLFSLALGQGAIVLATIIAIFAIAFSRGQGEADARTLTFATLILAYLGLILTNRSWVHSIIEVARRPNRVAWVVCAGGVGLLALVLAVPVLRETFHFTALHADDLAICLGGAVASTFWLEVVKVFRRRARTAPANTA